MKIKLDIKIKGNNLNGLKEILDELKEIKKDHLEITEVNIEVIV